MDEELKKDEEELTANKELVINSIPTHSKQKHSKLRLTTSVHGEHCRGSSQPEAEQGVHLGTQIFLWLKIVKVKD